MYSIMANVSLSFEENSENETNVERLNNNLELLDVTSEIHCFSDFMACNFENHTSFEDQLQNVTSIYVLVVIQTQFQNP